MNRSSHIPDFFYLSVWYRWHCSAVTVFNLTCVNILHKYLLTNQSTFLTPYGYKYYYSTWFCGLVTISNSMGPPCSLAWSDWPRLLEWLLRSKKPIKRHCYENWEKWQKVFIKWHCMVTFTTICYFHRTNRNSRNFIYVLFTSSPHPRFIEVIIVAWNLLYNNR